MEIVVFWMIFGAIAAALLSKSNRAGIGCMLGLLLGPIGIIIAWVMREKASDAAKVEEQKTASQSQAEVVAAAVKMALEADRAERESKGQGS